MNDNEKYKDKILTVFSIEFNFGGWQKRGITVIIWDKEVLFIPIPKIKK
jgi:hypothetical protein